MARGRSPRRRYHRRSDAEIEAQARREEDQQLRGAGWTPRTVGTTDDDTIVTFREGLGENEGHTLIADGIPSGRAFDRRGEHNHYGYNRESGGRVEDGEGDRGYYTGPGH